ncbi:hypothetical protein GWE18_07960 [Bradyrhizobium sp. CSA112]|uniref:hypothetical protein n=1 Tax=Bradyrhizobium sp. CSA112 TaxID=2699170 RepID=UPI0023B1FD93|nr:hypothetical protein [Bradyrhizobium sp. CSA112]MDE5452803.1 hypothetical protein [Bradyrhizobium sp. CSA112]
MSSVLRRCFNKPHEWYRVRRARSESKFDREFGTDTETVVPLWKLEIDSQYRDEGTRYQTIDPDAVRIAIENLPIEFEDFVYIDLGSGKGRTLLIASEYPFKQTVGVEFSLELHTIATGNIDRYSKRKCKNVSSLHLDAASFDFPPDNMVIYMYHPFGESVFRRVLENLEVSLDHRDREVYVIYFNPVLANLLDDSAFLERIELPALAAIYKHIPSSRPLA